MIAAISIGVDKLVDIAVSFDFDLINSSNIPFGQNEQLIRLLSEILNSQFNSDFNFEVCGDFGVKLFEVLSLRCRIRSVLPQFIQRNQQFAAGS